MDMVESLHGIIDRQDTELSDLRASNARMSEVLNSIRDRLGIDENVSILEALDAMTGRSDSAPGPSE